MTQYAFFFNQKRCLGCKTCVIACKEWNESKRGDANLNRALTEETAGTFDTPASWGAGANPDQEQLGSDILKIAVMAHNTGDALNLMNATWKTRNYFSRKPMLTMAMGKDGVLSRMTGEFTGSDITFCMVGGKPSAPGQIPSEEAEQILNSIHKAMYPAK